MVAASSPPPVLATTEAAVGFKDWALVCAALGSGRQSLILRKGGIAEGRDGFRFKHERFFLFPTQYHQQTELVRPEERAGLHPAPPAPEGTVEIRHFFALEFAVWVDQWSRVAALAPFHVWKEEVIRSRFDYDDAPGLQCAFGRVYRLDAPWSFPDRPGYGGCRSWVNLPSVPAGTDATPVLADTAHAERTAAVRAVLELPPV